MARKGHTTTPPNWQPPAEFDEYRLGAAIGAGGMGQVYLARDQFLDRMVAVKFLLDVQDGAAGLDRFRIEARAIARLQHPNVVVVHRIGEAAGYPYIVSELIRGKSLAELPKPVPWRRALEIGIGLARGLATAHARGVLHRDIKAANAMLGDDGTVKLLDFGLAKLTQSVGLPEDSAPMDASGSLKPSEVSAPVPMAPLAKGDATSVLPLAPVVTASRRSKRGTAGFAETEKPDDTLRDQLLADLVGADAPATLPVSPAQAAAVAAAIEAARAASMASASAKARAAEAADIPPTLPAPVKSGQAPPIDPAKLGTVRLAPHTPASAAAAVQDLPVPGAPAEPTMKATTPQGGLREEVGSVTHAGTLLGTPMYMPPEAWRAEPLTPRSDVYSLGVVLYELCCGRPPAKGQAMGLAQLAAVVNTRDAPRLRDVAPDVDADFAAVIDRCLARDPAARYETASELRDALEELASTARGAAVPEGNPYRGLHAFEAEHRALFFGRDAATREVLERLRGEAFVVIAGDSGAGKSSLVRAGVIPAVVDGALADGRRWRIARMMPSGHPLQALVAAIALAARLDEASLLADTQKEPAALGRAIRRACGADDGVLVLVDQLEELVTVSDPAEAELLVDAIRQLAVSSPSIRVLATVRGDFLTRVAAKFGRPEEIVRAVYLLLPPGTDELRSAVVGPARLKGVAFESDALVDELVGAGARAEGGLPLLQFALAQLWNARAAGDKVIRAATLAAIGGVEGALARHADEVLARLLPTQREAARRVLLRLVTVEGTRARRSEAELVGDDPEARTALDALVRGRLLVAREGEDGAAYEVAHEALIRGWSALREWHEQSREARAVEERLTRAVTEWDRLHRPPDALWSDRQIAELTLLAAPPSGHAAEFVTASRSTLRRRRWRRRLVLAAIPVVVIGIYAGVQVRDRATLDRRIQDHAMRARQHLGDAQKQDAEASTFRTMALAQFDGGDASAEDAWTTSRTRSNAARDAYAAASLEYEGALLLDANRDSIREALANLTYQRMLLAESVHDESQLADLEGRLALWDVGGVQDARWNARATVTLESTLPGPVSLERYIEQDGVLVATPMQAPSWPIRNLVLAPGSYRFTIGTGEHQIRYPVVLGRGEQFRAAVDGPRDPVPEGFVFVPAGRFLAGYSGEEQLRRYFFYSSPLHDVTTAAFSIARHEVSLQEWMEFLDAQSVERRSELGPRTSGANTSLGSVFALSRSMNGEWSLEIQPTTTRFHLTAGTPLVYVGRPPMQWEQLPVTAVSARDAEAYMRWLDETGRVPGARFCDDREWVRAARGADGRLYPDGNVIDAKRASIFDQARPLSSAGPAPVGMYPARSPFDVDDLSGNVWDLVRGGDGKFFGFGGSWYNDAFTAIVVNRQPVDPDLRDVQVGLRICASP